MSTQIYKPRYSEYSLVIQKHPKKAKGVWQNHSIPDVWTEKIETTPKKSPHQKPIQLQTELIKAVSNQGDIVLNPAAGSFSVLTACQLSGRTFLGCDLNS